MPKITKRTKLRKIRGLLNYYCLISKFIIKFLWYCSSDFIRRLKWENNRKIIARHNIEALAGRKTFKLAMNKFGDLVMACKKMKNTKTLFL